MPSTNKPRKRFSDQHSLHVIDRKHIHFFKNITSSSSIQEHAAFVGYGGTPIYCINSNTTYFPFTFTKSDLLNAYQRINEGSGWTIEYRGQGKNRKKSYVGEYDNGFFNARIALYHNYYGNTTTPVLITAYPVSNKDRQNHPDFVQIATNRDNIWSVSTTEGVTLGFNAFLLE